MTTRGTGGVQSKGGGGIGTPFDNWGRGRGSEEGVELVHLLKLGKGGDSEDGRGYGWNCTSVKTGEGWWFSAGGG